MVKKIMKTMGVVLLSATITFSSSTINRADEKMELPEVDMFNEKVVEEGNYELNSQIVSDNKMKSINEQWISESLLPTASMLSLATPGANKTGNTKAELIYTVTGLKYSSAIQNFSITGSYIYITQFDNSNSTILSRCKITGTKSAQYMDHMFLSGFGHGESLALSNYNNKTYFYLGAVNNSKATYKENGVTKYPQWSKQIARIQYQAGKTLKSSDVPRFSYLNRANPSGVSRGNVWRSACAVTSKQIVFRTQFENGNIQYSFFPISKMNAVLSEAENKSNKEVSFSNNTTLQKMCTNSIIQKDANNNIVMPNGNFQGMDLSEVGNVYLTGGSSKNTYNRIARMGSDGTYKFRWDVTGLGQYTTEIEGIKCRGNDVVFALEPIPSKITSTKKIYKAPVSN